MPSHSEIRELPYTAEQMHSLVLDIEKYPDFLPWCTGARILSKDMNENIILADLVIGFRAFNERFTSSVYYETPDLISVTFKKGPFKHLINNWHFYSMGPSCKVSFDIDFEFQSRILSAVMAPLFHEAVCRMVGAFESRAARLYS